MNNEEKILQLLVQLNEKVDSQGERLESLEGRMGSLEDRMGSLEDHVQELDQRSLRSAVLLEGEVLPKLQLLYEGQVNLQQTLAPKERVEVLEDEVITLKTMMKSLSKRLSVLEKAQ